MAEATELEGILIRLMGDGSSYMNMMHQGVEAAQHTAEAVEHAGSRIEAIQHRIERFSEAFKGALEFLGLREILHKAFEAFEGREHTLIGLSAVLKSNGRDVQEVTKDYKEFAKAQAEVSMVGAGDTMKMLKTAESYKLTGNAAKYAVQQAIGLSSIASEGTSPEALLRVTAMIAKGEIERAQHFTRHMIPQLKEYKNAEEFATEAKRLGAVGLETQAEYTKTAEGALHHLSLAVKGLYGDLGETVANAVKPFVEWLKEVIMAIRNLSPGMKQLAVYIAAAGAAFLMIGPIVAGLSIILGPIFSTGGFLVGGLIAVGVYLAKTTGILGWFKQKWVELVEYLTPAIRGIAAAIEAGDIELAFKIVWAQIQVTFAEATGYIKRGWLVLVYDLKSAWINFKDFVASIWVSFVGNFERGLLMLRYYQGAITKEAAASDLSLINQGQQIWLNKLESERAVEIAKIKSEGASGLKDMQANLARLKGERDTLIEQAEEAAKKIKKHEIVNAIPDDLKHMDLKIHPKFDAAAAGSVEALARIAEFRDKIQMKIKTPAKEVAKAALSPEVPQVTVEAPTKEDRQFPVLHQMRDILAKHYELDKGRAIDDPSKVKSRKIGSGLNIRVGAGIVE